VRQSRIRICFYRSAWAFRTPPWTGRRWCTPSRRRTWKLYACKQNNWQESTSNGTCGSWLRNLVTQGQNTYFHVWEDCTEINYTVNIWANTTILSFFTFCVEGFNTTINVNVKKFICLEEIRSIILLWMYIHRYIFGAREWSYLCRYICTFMSPTFFLTWHPLQPGRASSSRPSTKDIFFK
jgi:hypothetical protein